MGSEGEITDLYNDGPKIRGWGQVTLACASSQPECKRLYKARSIFSMTAYWRVAFVSFFCILGTAFSVEGVVSNNGTPRHLVPVLETNPLCM